MASNNIVFQQTTNKSGDTEFRVKFGRSKSLVYRRHEQYYSIDVYDNRPERSKFNGICFGLDEIDFLLSIRSNLDSLKTCFPQVQPSTSSLPRYENRAAFIQPPPSPPAGGNQQEIPTRPIYQASPFQDVNGRIQNYTIENHQSSSTFKRPSSRGVDLEPSQAKKSRFDSVVPVSESDENTIPQDVLNELFYYQMN